MTENLESYKCRYNKNYPYFGIIGEPFDRKQHPNQQKGLDIYVRCVNFDTGEICMKKLYENTKGIYFKHTGYSSMYISEFNDECLVFPFQVLKC